ncbi:DUF58 domain-containing protein [Sorangium sp. So ce327]|uniref:DUF58 domain-containing protein n=1 Tax=Sorangium sp. So ce327 TaxID=3133301 RepID=UPI003F6470C1
MIPSRALVLLAIVPLGLAVATLVDRTLLLPMLAADAGIALWAAIDALLARRPLVTVKRHAPAVLSIGRPNLITLEIRSLSRRKLSIEVADDLFDHAESDDLPVKLELPPRERATARYHVRPTRRGAHTIGDHHVRYLSPFGLWIRQVTVPAETPVKVYPDVQAVRTFELMARQDRDPSALRASRKRGGESEFERLREYRRGDEFRSIDWKATARQKKIISREYQLESNQNLLFLLDAGRLMTAQTQGLSLFDHALNASLMLSHVAARGGDRVGLLAFADGIKSYAPPVSGAGAAKHVLSAGYDLYPELVETNYGAAFQHVGLRVRKRSLIVLFTQVVDDVAASELLRLMRGVMPRHLPLMVLLRDVEIDALVEGGDADPYTRGAAAELSSFRDRLVRDLKNQGALVLDVAPGQLTGQLINRYLEIKARHLL